MFFLVGFITFFGTDGNNLLTADDRTALQAGSSSKS